MLNLIKLEIKKYKFNGHWLGVLIANVVIMGLVALMYFDQSSLEEGEAFLSYGDAFFFIDTMVRATFIIYASVLLSKFVIDEYRNKTISLMFTYPINRKKLMASKLVIVFVWTLLAIILSNFALDSALLLLNSQFGLIPDKLVTDTIVTHIMRTLINAMAAAGLSLIPLFFGMWKKSVAGTIVSAVLIVSVFNSSVGNVSLYSFVVIPILLAAIGIIVAYVSIRNVDKVDLV